MSNRLTGKLKELFDAMQAAQQRAVLCHDEWRKQQRLFDKGRGSIAEELERLRVQFIEENSEFIRLQNEFQEAAINEQNREREKPRKFLKLRRVA